MIGPKVYKMLRTVLEETSEATFSDLLEKMLQVLEENAATSSFCKYFVSEWVPRAREWAFCYRRELGITTNMYVEAFHRTFKHNYLKGKFNQRVDTCLLNLVKFIQDKMFDRVVKLTKGKLTSRIKDIQLRHITAQRLRTTKPNAVKLCEEGQWEVKSEMGKEIYKVVKVSDVCSLHCNLACQSGCKNTCIHTFSCTCADSLMRGTVCKHIHLVSMLTNNNNCLLTPTSSTTPDSGEVDSRTEELQLLVSQIKKNSTPQPRTDELKMQVKAKLLQLLTDVDNCTNSEALQELDRGLSAKQFLFHSMLKQPTGTVALPAKVRYPANKNADRQRRFAYYSTKAKRKRQGNATCIYTKPTEDEKKNFKQKGWSESIKSHVERQKKSYCKRCKK